MQQICINSSKEITEAHKEKDEQFDNRRIRYDIPTYLKFYSLYQYDRLKFRNLMNIWLETKEGKNRTYLTLYKKQKEILELCYIKDEKGQPLRDCDEKNIISIRALHYEPIFNVLQKKRQVGYHEKLYEYLMGIGVVPVLMTEEEKNSSFEYKGLMIYCYDKQAEILGSWDLPIRERVLLHKKLLKMLYNGIDLEEALRELRNDKMVNRKA